MDLADQIDDYICSFEGIDLQMDSLAMFIFVWAVLVLFLVWLCKFLYNKYVNTDPNSNTAAITAAGSKPTSLSNGAKLEVSGDKLRKSEPKEILSTKDVKELSAKPKGGAVGGRGRSDYVNPARKRIVRQSPGPELRKRKTILPPQNVVGPETTSVTWTSQVFRWLYSDLVIINELLNTWVQALNDTLRNSNETNGVGIEVIRVLPDSPPPSLTNLFCQANENNPADMVITCDCDAQPVLQIKSFRQKSGKMETSHYKLTVSRFRGHLSSAMNYNTLKGDMRVEGYPDIRIAMNSVGAIKPIDQDEQQLQNLISEILTHALRDTVYPIDFSIYATCPRSEIEQPEIPVNYYDYYDQNNIFDPMALNVNNRLSSSQLQSTKRLLVKIVKGEGLIAEDGAYVVIEMDEPPQKNQTGSRQGSEPYWDEHFLFDISQQSQEILFEVYDSPKHGSNAPKFLGLGLVGIDELSVGPASSQILALQPRPYETENVHGAIIVEFVFIEGAEIPIGPRPYKLKEALRINTVSINEHLQNGEDLADAAVKALKEGALATNSNPSKSTLIIHSVQRNRSPFKVELNKKGQIEIKENSQDDDYAGNLNTDITASPTDSYPSDFVDNKIDRNIMNETGNGFNLPANSDEFGRPAAQSSPHQKNGNGNLMLNQTDSLHRDGNLTEPEDDDRGRKKKRDFFGTLKRRLGRSKTRANSADLGMIPIDADNPTGTSRSLSMDRGVNSNSPGAKIVVPTLNHSRRSSISESSAISGFSSTSTKTFLHEASTLVLETIENGVKRHFLVPLAIAQKPKWRRKGTKLHIYNDHTFVAKHLSGSGLTCAICLKSIPRRPGKQGYECRDCQLICHKQCHIRAPQSCPNPTILSMELSKLNSAADRSRHN